MCRALPGSEYYDGSAPPRSDRPTVCPARSSAPEGRGSGETETVPVFTEIRSTKEEPSSIPAASPRLPRSTSPWPPGRTPACLPGSSPPRRDGTGAHRARPLSARFEPVYLSRDVMTLVPRVLLSVTLAEPTPSGDPGASRLCQGCSHPPRHLPGRAALSFDALLRQDDDEGLPPPFETSAPHGARGFRYNPTTSRTLASSSGSVEDLGIVWKPLVSPPSRYPWSVFWRAGDSSEHVRAFVHSARVLSRRLRWLEPRRVRWRADLGAIGVLSAFVMS